MESRVLVNRFETDTKLGLNYSHSNLEGRGEPTKAIEGSQLQAKMSVSFHRFVELLLARSLTLECSISFRNVIWE